MPTELAQLGTGLTIAFASGFFAEIVDATPPGMSRESIDTTHMETVTARTFKPVDLYDPGELTAQIHFDPATTPPISSARETVTITFRNGDTWAFEGFMTGYEPRTPLEDKAVADVRIKASGVITITASSS